MLCYSDSRAACPEHLKMLAFARFARQNARAQISGEVLQAAFIIDINVELAACLTGNPRTSNVRPLQYILEFVAHRTFQLQFVDCNRHARCVGEREREEESVPTVLVAAVAAS